MTRTVQARVFAQQRASSSQAAWVPMLLLLMTHCVASAEAASNDAREVACSADKLMLHPQHVLSLCFSELATEQIEGHSLSKG